MHPSALLQSLSSGLLNAFFSGFHHNHDHKATPIRIPGTIPAMNISAIDTPVIEAYTTNAILGGMTMAMELDVAIRAVENGALKLPALPLPESELLQVLLQLQVRIRKLRRRSRLQ